MSEHPVVWAYAGSAVMAALYVLATIGAVCLAAEVGTRLWRWLHGR